MRLIRPALMGLVLCGLVAPVHALVIDSESFEPPFDLFTDPDWTVAAGQEFSINVVDSGLSYNRGAVTVDGGTQALEIGPGLPPDIINNLVDWNFAETTSDNVWFSYLLQSSVDASTALPDENDARDFFQVFISEAGNQAQSLSINLDNVGVPGADHALQARAGASNNVNAISNILNTPEETFLLVGHVEKVGAEYETISLFINPGSPETPISPAAMATFSGLTPTLLSQLTVRIAFLEDDDAYLIDEIRIGETYEDVVTIDPDFLAGDFNSDDVLDEEDFDVLASNLFTGTLYEQGDFDFSGLVDLHDFIAFRGAFHAAGLSASNVPEPASLALFALGGLLFLGSRRRRRRR